MSDILPRCAWAQNDPAQWAYHDTEWGVPVRDSRTLWEHLMLDCFQAGLSWRTILLKREAFRRAFEGFDPARIALYGENDIERLMADSGIVRSRQKITATIRNARDYLSMQDHGEDFSDFVWSFTDNKPVLNQSGTSSPRSPQGDALSLALKKRGFSFVGPVIVHAWLQACGLINDHEPGCFCHAKGNTPTA
jgi:DNA-3-methyladenine glycosylase I